MATINGIQLHSSTAASLRRIARANRRKGETIGAALRRITAKCQPAVHQGTGEIIFAPGEGVVLDQHGWHLRTWNEGWPYNTGWYTLRQREGHQPKRSATPGCAYGAHHYW